MKKINYCMMSIFLSFLLMVSLIAGKCSAVRAETIQENDSRLEKALLSEDWKKVADLLGSVDTETPSPALRLIKGHACLALNRNNESLCLFLSVSTDEERKEWEKWTHDFANKNQKSAIAYYFKGDALARLKQWDNALIAFNDALKLKQNHPLVLNARGVTYAAMGSLDNALIDFDHATVASEVFADAFCNLGAVAIQQKEGAKGAETDFTRALNKSADFAFALYGRGCVMLVLGKWEKANEDLRKAILLANCLSGMLSSDIENILQKIEEKQKTQFASIDGNNPGFGLESRTINALKEGRWGVNGFWAKEMIKQNASNPHSLNQIYSAMNECAKNKPGFAPYVPKYFNEVAKDNARFGTLNNVNEFTKSSLSAQATSKIGKNTIVGSGSFDSGKNLTRDLTNFNTLNNQQFKNINSFANKASNAGGFKTDLNEAIRDEESDWLFSPKYGLLYSISNEEYK